MPSPAPAPPAVLLVDDVHANLVALEALLGGLSCVPVRAGSGNEALKHLLKQDFAVMLLDVQMPGIDGYEVAKLARANPATAHVPIIFLTATQRGEEQTLRGYGAGAVDFLYKPLDAAILRSKVTVFLDLYEGKRRLALEVEARRRAQAHLEMANEALRHFTTAASHDLRAPLRAMNAFLEALANEAGGRLEGRPRELLARSRAAAERMVALLDALLVYAGLQRPVAWADVSLESTVDQVLTDLADRVAAAHAAIERGPLPAAHGDQNRLYQLFLNLVSNALKFRHPDRPPVIEISSAMRDGERIYVVADNGIGIDAEYRTIVFDGFKRLHGDRGYEGSGLGLSIVRQIVEQHGGRVWVEAGPAGGSRFCFTLAARAADPVDRIS